MNQLALTLLKTGAGIATGSFMSNIALATTPATVTKAARLSATIGASITGMLISELFVEKVCVPTFNDVEETFEEVRKKFKEQNDK